MPRINVDDLSDADRAFWPIHACPQSHAPAHGSIAVWDQYLESADDQLNGDLFASQSSASSGGIIAVIVAGCEAGDTTFYDSVRVTSDSPDCPMAAMDANCFAKLDPSGAPSCMHPGGLTDPSGVVIGVCDSASTDTTVLLTFQDLKAGRSLMWPPFEVPVAHGTISVVWAAAIGGVAGAHFKETAACAGLFGPEPHGALRARAAR